MGHAMMPVTASLQSPDMQVGRIAQFVRDYVLRPKPKCTAFGIAHEGEQGAQMMSTYPVPPKLTGDALDDFVQKTAHDLQEQARADVLTQTRAQRYLVIAYESGDRVMGRWPIQLYPPVQNQLGGPSGETEPANATGLLGHGMRHSEVVMRLGLGHTNSLLELYKDEVVNLRSRCSELENKNSAMIEAREKLMSEQFARDLAYQREKRQDERLERLYVQVEKFIPVLAAKYGVVPPQLGAAATPAPDAQKEPVKAFMHLYFTLSEKQKEGILEVLSDEQKMRFVEIVKGCMAALQGQKEAS